MPAIPFPRDEGELEVMRAVAESGRDKPVLMLNLNRYAAEAGYPDGELYRRYMAVLEDFLPCVGAKVLWRSPVLGHPVGDQKIDEVLAAWYPTHRAFLELPDIAGAEKNYRLRGQCVEYAAIHRCPGERYPMSPV